MIAISVVFIAIVFYSKNKISLISENINAKQNYAEQTVEDVGANSIVSSVQILQKKTGTGPFDSDDSSGNDSSEDNDVVRSFDQIVWTIENTMSLKESATVENYTGGTLEITAKVPESCSNVVKWDLDSMAWAENASVSDDGTVFTAQYSMTETDITVPGKQSLVLVLKVFSAPNGLEIKPEFTLNLVGNTESEKITISDTSEVTVSAAPSYNINITRNSMVNYRSYFDFLSNNESETATDDSIYGRMQGYGITLQLYNSDASKSLKGIEIPKGDITFDITFNQAIGTTDVTNQDGYTPIMWEYKENLRTSKDGKNGRNMF